MKNSQTFTRPNSRGFGHLLVVIALVVILAVAGAGYLVYRHQHTAHAGGYTSLGTAVDSFTNVKVAEYACKQYINAYGGVWAVRAIYTKSASSSNANYSLETLRNNKIISFHAGTSWYYNTVASLTTDASIPLGDTIGIGTNSRSWMVVYPASLKNC